MVATIRAIFIALTGIIGAAWAQRARAGRFLVAILGASVAEIQHQQQQLQHAWQLFCIETGIGAVLVIGLEVVIVIVSATCDHASASWTNLILITLQALICALLINLLPLYFVMRYGALKAGIKALTSSIPPKKGSTSPTPKSATSETATNPLDEIMKSWGTNLVEMVKASQGTNGKSLNDVITIVVGQLILGIGQLGFGLLKLVGWAGSKIEGGSKDIYNETKSLVGGLLSGAGELGMSGLRLTATVGDAAIQGAGREAVAWSRGVWSIFTYLMFVNSLLILFPMRRNAAAIPMLLIVGGLIFIAVRAWGFSSRFGRKMIVLYAIVMFIIILLNVAIPATFLATPASTVIGPTGASGPSGTSGPSGPSGVTGPSATTPVTESYLTDWIGAMIRKIWPSNTASGTGATGSTGSTGITIISPSSPVAATLTKGALLDTFKVESRKLDWQSTGVTYSAGRMFYFEVDGDQSATYNIYYHQKLRFGPDGDSRTLMNDSGIPGTVYGEVVAGINGIGQRLGWTCNRVPNSGNACDTYSGYMQANVSGKLTFKYVDTIPTDNKGAFEIRIYEAH